LITIQPMLPTSPLLLTWCEHYCVAYAADSGTTLSPQPLHGQILAESPSEGVFRWAAWLDSELVGLAQSRSNGDRGFVRLYVHAAHRRRGIGRQILEAIRSQVAVRTLRSVVNAGDAGEHFATAAGAHVVMRLVVMSQDLTRSESTNVELPSGYELAIWRERTPANLLTGYAAVKRHIADAPDGHEQVDPDWDEARVREWEQALFSSAQTLYVSAAVHDGAVIGFTEAVVGHHPAGAQHDTVVMPSHRGAGLAVALKAALVRHLRAERPDIISLSSTINAANTPMIAANRRLGYRIERERLLVEATVSC
jgi:GNAT superfamily N-acetyltransferase